MSVSTSTIPQVRTGNEVEAVEAAIEVLRRLEDVVWSPLCQLDSVRSAILADVTANFKFEAVERIAGSNPGLHFHLDGGTMHVETWLQRVAAEVLFQVIRDIVSINPAHGEQDRQRWVFLGRTIERACLRSTKLLRGLTVDESELIDLWCSADGRTFLVVTVGGNYTVPAGPQATCDRTAIEAYRRSLQVGLIPA
jgi:hypothetical protein